MTQTTESTIERRLESARQMRQRKDYAGAEQYLSALIRRAKGNMLYGENISRLLNERASVRMSWGHEDAAFDDYITALAISAGLDESSEPKYAYAAHSMIENKGKNSGLEYSHDFLETALACTEDGSKGQARALAYKSLVFTAQKEFGSALTLYESAREGIQNLDDKQEIVLLGWIMGRLAMRQGEHLEAIKNYTLAWSNIDRNAKGSERANLALDISKAYTAIGYDVGARPYLDIYTQEVLENSFKSRAPATPDPKFPKTYNIIAESLKRRPMTWR